MHLPVLLSEVLSMTEREAEPRLYLDCTFGRGGHMKAIKGKYSDLKIVAVDRDQAAIEYANKEFANWISSKDLNLFRGNFMNL
ncbi:MAG: 16S rRNA (cytosine(1402)-N(4))-methyltransferase, partial [Bdellovibrionales bacterium]|nr:16S rRNA (cytosine(1402)-N(4))-methyltransferase [Bdellovibrionales bacterium]